MSGISYFEMGGHVIETVVPSDVPRPQAVTARSISKQMNVPTPVVKAVSKDVQDKTGIDPLKVAEKYGRARRARWAIATAIGMAAADGPLPFGDIAAIGFLGAYGAYEAYMIVTDW